MSTWPKWVILRLTKHNALILALAPPNSYTTKLDTEHVFVYLICTSSQRHISQLAFTSLIHGCRLSRCRFFLSNSCKFLILFSHCKDQLDFFLCIFRTLPGLNIAVIENCTFWNVEGAVFKLSTLSFSFSIVFPILSLFVFIYKGSRKKNHASL